MAGSWQNGKTWKTKKSTEEVMMSKSELTALQLIEAVIEDTGKWYSQEFRKEYIYVLKRLVSKGAYDKVLNGLMYSYWKMHKSERLMSGNVAMDDFSCENAWDILLTLNDIDIPLPFSLKQRILSHPNPHWVAFLNKNKKKELAKHCPECNNNVIKIYTGTLFCPSCEHRLTQEESK